MVGSSSELTSTEPGSLGVVKAPFKSRLVDQKDINHVLFRELEIE